MNRFPRRTKLRQAVGHTIARWGKPSLIEPLENRVLLSVGSVVINEINYNPPDKTKPSEFVELTNPGTTPLDLSGAAFTSGIHYTFPANTSLAPGAYLVVAEDPATLQQMYGVPALGPFTGKLSNEGNDLIVQDAAGNTLDEVDYGVGFPWPIVGDSPGPGYSIELINPTFDNNLGGNWRSFTPSPATQVTLISSGSKWDYRKGTAEPTNPTTLWQNLYYVEDSNWKSATAPIGYDPQVAMGTPLTDMNGGYSTVYFRDIFYIPDPSEALGLTLQAQYDDGINVWINGHLVQSANMPSTTLAFSGTATAAREDNSFQSFSISPAFLQAGDNVIAVQLANISKSGSDDAFFNARLLETNGTGGPTPGRQNSVFATNAPPDMRQVANTPQQPAANQAVTITAKVTDPDGVSSVSLSYQVVDAGNYIAREDAAYSDPANWTTLVMRDDGTNGDATANDSIYTAVLPASVQVNRRLVRYRVTSVDALGNSVTGPYPDNPVPNFAYYVYNGIPSYSAALQPGATGSAGQVLTYSPATLSSIPVIQLITKQQDHDNSQDIPTGTIPGYTGSENAWSGTLVFNGVVYDDIHYRPRGGVWRFAMGKNMWKIDFENGHDFQMYYPDGTPYPVPWKKLDLGADIQQGDIGMRGEQGLFETLSFEMFNLAGVAAPATIPLEFRIVENASESGTSQYTTDFQGMYLAVEQMDGRFLAAHGLSDGNLYKMEGGTGNGGGSSNNQGSTQPSDNSDLVAFVNALNANPTDQWIQDNIDLPEFYSFQAVVEMIHHWDIGFGKNYFYYHNPDNNKWEILPWDTDLTWYVNYEPAGGDQDPFANVILKRPEFQLQYRNRVRELRDLLFTSEQIGQMADTYAKLVNPPGGATMVNADAAVWDYNPIMTSPYVNSSKSGAGRYYLGGSPTHDFPGMVSELKVWAAARLLWIDKNVITPTDQAAAPLKPIVTATGPANFPADQLTFTTNNFTAGNTGAGFAAMQWRLSDITSTPGQPPNFEINSVWDSGVLSTFNAAVTVPSGAVVAGHMYRIRVRMQDTNGRWSDWSDVTFGVSQFVVSSASAILRDLRLTELNYDPAKPPTGSPYNNDDFEYVELKNFGTQTLNLAGLQFTDGITYTFGNVSLAPGQAGVLVKNTPAFQSRYGTSIQILGDYLSTGQSFSNSGEHVALVDSNGQTIADFTYATAWSSAAHGNGSSLEVINPIANLDLNNAANWRASVTGGTPGAESSIVLIAPSGLASSAVTATQISLQWADNETHEQGYLVYRRSAGSGPFSQIANLGANATTFLDTNGGVGLSPGAVYEYRVQAYNASGFSDVADRVIQTLTLAPTNVFATPTPTNSTITLVWDAVPGAVSYSVYRGTAAGAESGSPIIANLISPAFIDSGVMPGPTYYYVVTATNTNGISSAPSSEASATMPLVGAIIGTAGSFANGGNTIAKAFDGNLTTYFDAPDPGNGDWVGLDFGAPIVVNAFSYAPRSGFTSRMVNGIFQGASHADFSDAVNLLTITTAPTAGVMTTQSIANSTAYRYVRYLAPNGGYGNIAELQFFGSSNPFIITGTSSDDTFYLKLNADGQHTDYWVNAAPTGAPTGQVQLNSGFNLKTIGGHDTVTFDQTAGRFTIAGGGGNVVTVGATGSLSINFLAGPGPGIFTLDGATNRATYNADALTVAGPTINDFTYTDSGGNDTFQLLSGGVPLTLNLTGGLDTLTIASGARATVNFGASNGDLTVANSGSMTLNFGSGSPNLQFAAAVGLPNTNALTAPTGAIAGRVFDDANGNGKRDASESALAGRTIYLDLNRNAKLDKGEPSTQTTADGSYGFIGLPAGKYRVREVLPASRRSTFPAAGYYDLTLSTGANFTRQDFGDAKAASISGHVFNDKNADGRQNNGEGVLAGRTVYIDANNNGRLDPGEQAVQTDSTGLFTFNGLSAGTYRIRMASETGWLATDRPGTYVVQIKAGQSATGLKLGEQQSRTAPIHKAGAR